MNGWRLVGTLSLLLGAMSLYLMASHGWDIEGVRLAIRATARTSLVLFALAFTAGAMVELLPSGATRWQRRNRRYLGVSFAVSHFIHLGVILALAALDRELFWKLTNVTTIVLAGDRLPVHRGDGGDLVRPHGRLAGPAQVAAAAPDRRLVHLDQLRRRRRQARAARQLLLADGCPRPGHRRCPPVFRMRSSL